MRCQMCKKALKISKGYRSCSNCGFIERETTTKKIIRILYEAWSNDPKWSKDIVVGGSHYHDW